MFKRRLVSAVAFAALFSLGVGVSIANAGDEGEKKEVVKCKKPTMARVKKACEAGGQAKATSLMKSVVAKAKKEGEEMNCKTCHTSLKPDFPVKPDAKKKLAKYF